MPSISQCPIYLYMFFFATICLNGSVLLFVRYTLPALANICTWLGFFFFYLITKISNQDSMELRKSILLTPLCLVTVISCPVNVLCYLLGIRKKNRVYSWRVTWLIYINIYKNKLVIIMHTRWNVAGHKYKHYGNLKVSILFS